MIGSDSLWSQSVGGLGQKRQGSKLGGCPIVPMRDRADLVAMGAWSQTAVGGHFERHCCSLLEVVMGEMQGVVGRILIQDHPGLWV